MNTSVVEDCETFRIAEVFAARYRRDARARRARAGLSAEGIAGLRFGADGEMTVPDGSPAIRLGLHDGKGGVQEIRVVGTACRFGGARVWMACECGRRCAVLYLSAGRWRCFRCAGVPYEKQVWRSRNARRLAVATAWLRRPSAERAPFVVAELRRLGGKHEARAQEGWVARVVCETPALREAIHPRYRDLDGESVTWFASLDHKPAPAMDADTTYAEWLNGLDPAMRERMLELDLRICLLNAAADAVGDGDLRAILPALRVVEGLEVW
jgi:hypothetical protein